MPIYHGDFFDDHDRTPVAFHAGNSGKVPFEDSVREYIRSHPGDSYQDCATALGICYGAVAFACENLIAKGEATPG